MSFTFCQDCIDVILILHTFYLLNWHLLHIQYTQMFTMTLRLLHFSKYYSDWIYTVHKR